MFEPNVVTVGEKHDLTTDHTPLESWRWVGDALGGDELWLQCSAHGRADPGRLADDRVVWSGPHRRIAAGQSVVAYDADGCVVGGGIAARQPA